MLNSVEPSEEVKKLFEKYDINQKDGYALLQTVHLLKTQFDGTCLEGDNGREFVEECFEILEKWQKEDPEKISQMTAKKCVECGESTEMECRDCGEPVCWDCAKIHKRRKHPGLFKRLKRSLTG